MFLDTCLTILDIAEKTTKLFDWFTGLSSGDEMSSTVKTLSKNNAKIERLSDKILYAPNLQQAVNKESPQILSNQKQIYDLVNPFAEALETDVLASAVVSTPEKLRKAFKKDPWELLIDVRPANRTKRPNNPDLIPIMFIDNGLQYIGWQTRGTLPILFNCDFEYNGSLYVPSNNDKQVNKNKEAPGVLTKEEEEDIEVKLANDLCTWFSEYASTEGFYIFPNIPDGKLTNALEKFTINYEEMILALIDCTSSGSAADFLAFGVLGAYYHNSWNSDQPGFHFIPYKEFSKRNFFERGIDEISVGKGASLRCKGSKLKRSKLILILSGIAAITKKYTMFR
jgi:hypothetical protein